MRDFGGPVVALGGRLGRPRVAVAAAHRSLDLADWVWANPRTVDRLFGPVPAGRSADA